MYDPFAADFGEAHPGFFILKADLANVYLGIVFAARMETARADEPLSFQEVFDAIKKDEAYGDLLGSIAAVALPSAKAYGKFMRQPGIIPLWKKLQADL